MPVVDLVLNYRFLIGYLGEKSQFDWWGSNFLGASSPAFLMYPYPRTMLLAQYHGVCEAALLVHDEYIGVGENYHLYRLPDSLEREVSKAVQNIDMTERPINKDSAFEALEQLVYSEAEKSEGPVNIGVFNDEGLELMLKVAASHYLNAFKEDYKSFPYMREA